MIDQILTQAATMIEEKGLCQGKPFGPGGEICTLAAIGEATKAIDGCSDIPRFRGHIATAMRWLKMAVNTPLRVHIWNDSPTTTTADVIAGLRLAAANYVNESKLET